MKKHTQFFSKKQLFQYDTTMRRLYCSALFVDCTRTTPRHPRSCKYRKLFIIFLFDLSWKQIQTKIPPLLRVFLFPIRNAHKHATTITIKKPTIEFSCSAFFFSHPFCVCVCMCPPDCNFCYSIFAVFRSAYCTAIHLTQS